MSQVVQFGKYQLLRKLASGGMAELFLARREGPMEFSKQVVIKRILPEFTDDPEFVRTFLNEARLAALLNHPSVVHVYELGRADNQYYIEMEYIEGENLQRLAQLRGKQGQRFSPREAATILAQVAEGLAHAHALKGPDGKALQLVHRDVSLDNILVSLEGNVKLVDFGIAKAAALTSKTRGDVIKGKVTYLSPEQALGGALDGRSDIFSLGVTLYYLMTATPPFKGQNEGETLRNVIAAQPRPPSQISPAIPRRLEEIILTALQREPANRFPNASAMASALQDFAIAQPKGLVMRPELAKLVAETLRGPSAPEKKAPAEGGAEGQTRVSAPPTRPVDDAPARPPPRPVDDGSEKSGGTKSRRAKPSAPRPKSSAALPAVAPARPRVDPDTAVQQAYVPKKKITRTSIAWAAGLFTGLVAGSGALYGIVSAGWLASGSGTQGSSAPPAEQVKERVESPAIEPPRRPPPAEVRRPQVKSPAAVIQPVPPPPAAPVEVAPAPVAPPPAAEGEVAAPAAKGGEVAPAPAQDGATTAPPTGEQ